MAETAMTRASVPARASLSGIRLLAINNKESSYRPVKPPPQSCRPLRRSERNLVRVERLLRTPGTYATNAPRQRQGRGEVLQPLPGCVSLFLFYPGVRFAHPRLSSFRPAGAQFGTTEAVPSRSEAMNTKFDCELCAHQENLAARLPTSDLRP